MSRIHTISMALVAIPLWSAVPHTCASGIDFIVHQDGTEEHTLLLARPESVEEPYSIPLEDVVGLRGYYLTVEPGWDGLGIDQPDANRVALLHEGGISLRRVSFDPGFVMFDLDLNPVLETDGETVHIGGEPESEEFAWHEHLVFGVEPGAEAGGEFQATFVLTDETGEHADSEPFTLTFVTAPAVAVGSSPSGACGAGSGGCGALGMVSLALTIAAMVRMRSRAVPRC